MGDPGQTEEIKISLPNDNKSTSAERFINVPEYFWKVVLEVQWPGQDARAVTASTKAFAVLLPNAPYPTVDSTATGTLRPYSITLPTRKVVNITSQDDWESWEKWKVNINDLERLTGLDFFSNIDKSIQEIIEGIDTPLTLTSPLMAVDFSGEGIQAASNNFFWENRIAIDNASSVNTLPNTFTQVSIGEVNAAQVALIQLGSLHGDISQDSSLKSGVFDNHIVQVTPNQNDTFAVGLTNSGTLKIGTSHISTLQESFPKVSIDKCGFTQIGETEDSAIKKSISQVSTTQISSSKVDALKITANNTNSTQVGISEFTASQANSIQSQIVQINPTEIPLTSSISLQQFLSSHNYALQNTTVPTWLSYLGGTTPFNLNIEITNLPTGQLAEAQVTGFAADGTPNAGTLLLDHNGNDLGWFIDPTPWENNEFTHNTFLVPDWGALRFDLHVPSLMGGELSVNLTVDRTGVSLGTIDLIGGREQDQIAYGTDGFGKDSGDRCSWNKRR